MVHNFKISTAESLDLGLVIGLILQCNLKSLTISLARSYQSLLQDRSFWFKFITYQLVRLN